MIIMDEDTEERLKYFENNYDLISNYNLKDIKGKDEEVFLGTKENKICRFCGRKEPEVTFDEKAHAIPELMGNKSLFTYYECDDCNRRFCKKLEKHLAAFMGISRTILGIEGKKRIPQYDKNNDKIYNKNGTVIVQTTIDNESNILEHNVMNKTMKIITKKDRYIPLSVYKCFVKMVLSIIDEKELEKINWAVEWLDEKKQKKNTYNIKPLILYVAFTPGTPIYEGIDVFLFRRKTMLQVKVPYIIFVIRFKNFVYQIYIPENDICGKYGKINYSYMCFPGASFEDIKVQYSYGDFSSEEYIDKNTKEEFELTYGKFIENEEIRNRAQEIINKQNNK